MIKARLVVEGNIQGVSYRALVKQIARRLGIKGLVRNLEDGGVEIFCECSKEVLQNFVKMIDKKGDIKEPFSLNVEKINIYNEGEKGYMNPPKEFVSFDVDYKIKLDPFQKESLEKSEIGGLLLVDTRDEVKGTRDEVKGSREDIQDMHKNMRKGQNCIKDSIQDMHKDLKTELKGFRDESKQSFGSLNKNLTGFREETKTEFQTIKTDYGKISQDLGKAVDSINTIAKSIEKLAEAIAKK